MRGFVVLDPLVHPYSVWTSDGFDSRWSTAKLAAVRCLQLGERAAPLVQWDELIQNGHVSAERRMMEMNYWDARRVALGAGRQDS